MTEKPIIFNGEMVRAILDGRKTQTRRIYKGPDPLQCRHADGKLQEHKGYPIGHVDVKCPYAIGDVLWVRESFRVHGVAPMEPKLSGHVAVMYRSTESVAFKCVPESHYDKPTSKRTIKHHSGRFMPRWAARIFLKVKAVGVERIRDISEADAEAEGASPENAQLYGRGGAYQNGFWELWDSINEKRGYGWDVNPYVWKYGFERIDEPKGESNE